MSDSEEEYEVESILRARVVKKGFRKIWHYHVKWKGYGQDANTWEPYESFAGSEHFVQAFWDRISGDRDRTRMELFKVGEEVFPVGPPGRIKGKKKVEQEVRTSPRRPPPLKRKPTDSEGEVQSIIDEDVDEAVSRPISTRKRRTSAVEQAAEPPSAKRRRGRDPIEIPDTDEEEVAVESISKAPGSARRTRASASTSEAAKSIISDRVTRSSASPRKISAKSQVTTQARQRIHKRNPSPEVIEIDSDEPVPETEDETSQSNLADESNNSVPADEPVSPTAKGNGSPKKTAARPLRASRSLTKPVAEVIAPSTPRAARSRPARKQAENGAALVASSSNGAQASSAPRAKISASRAGPGRSSKGIVASSAAPPTGTKSGLRTTQKQPSTPAGPAPARRQGTTPPSRADSVDLMAVDEQFLPPLTTEDLDRLASLSQPPATAPTPAAAPATDLPDVEATSDRDAEGEVDYDVAKSTEATESPQMVAKEVKTEIQTSVLEGDVAAEPEATEETPKEPEPVVPPAPKEPLINPIDAPLGNGGSRLGNLFSAWRKSTIFDSRTGGPSQPSPETPTAEQSESLSPTLFIPINASVRIPVILNDIQPSAEPIRKRLDGVAAEAQSAPQGPPGKFYKDQPAADMIKALMCGGSSARAVLQDGADASAKENFDRFCARLKDGALFVAMVGSHILAFCSSENSELASELGVSPNLAGLAENVLVSEVLIGDDSAYIDAVMNAEDDRW